MTHPVPAAAGRSAVHDPATPIACGDISALLIDGAVRRICFKGVEVVRGLDCPIRDSSWRTEVPENVEESLETENGSAHLTRRFTTFNGALAAEFQVDFSSARIAATLTLQARRTVQTNRAGFSLLHPVIDVAGEAMTIIHPDGSKDATRFPELISPGQPAFDIAGLQHIVQGVQVDVAFGGEVFEMEDQRNWTDASYKTYCRPLGLPFPYAIEAGETVTQSVTIEAAGEPTALSDGAGGTEIIAFPKVAVAVDPAWSSDASQAILSAIPDPVRLLRVDVASPNLDQLGSIEGHVDLEVIVDDDGDMETELSGLATELTQQRVVVERVMAIPRAYLKSYQPTGDWPSGHGIADAARAAASAFPDAEIVVGMLTNFTEFNRHPPPSDIGDHVTYSTTAIVHAGDDRSVFETLEVLPQVHASARALSGARPIRLGLATIGMRSNPYGDAVAANPAMDRIAMTMDDPRQQTVFAAAFAVGAYAAAAESGIARIALAGAGGPFSTGVVTDSVFRAWPVHHVVSALSEMASGDPGETPPLPRGVAGVFARINGQDRALVANCTLDAHTVNVPSWSGVLMSETTDVSAPDWFEMAQPTAAGTFTLNPADVLFLSRKKNP
ncbi:MAG: hypothetical protein AAGA88_01110 [Pseudomonadota bacterium]